MREGESFGERYPILKPRFPINREPRTSLDGLITLVILGLARLQLSCFDAESYTKSLGTLTRNFVECAQIEDVLQIQTQARYFYALKACKTSKLTCPGSKVNKNELWIVNAMREEFLIQSYMYCKS